MATDELICIMAAVIYAGPEAAIDPKVSVQIAFNLYKEVRREFRSRFANEGVIK